MDTPAWSPKLMPHDARPPSARWDAHADAVERKVEFHTRNIAGNSVLRGFGEDDVRQELRLALWLSLERYDPTRSALPTFLDHVAQNTIRSLVRRETAQRRDCRRHGPSLNAPDWERNGGPIANEVLQQRCSYSPAPLFLNELRRRENSTDVVAWMATLSEPLGQVADLLRQHRESKVAQLLGLSPRKVRDQVERLRRLYEDRRLRGDR